MRTRSAPIMVMKGSYFVLGVPNNRLTYACKVKKHFHCLIICIYFYLLAQRLPKDSLNDSFLQTPPLRDANLRWLVWLDSFSFHHACNAWLKQLLWAQCCFVYSVTRETAIFTLQKHLVAKNELAFSFRPKRKDQHVGGQYWIHFKNDSFKTRVDSFFWEKITLYILHERSFSKIHNRGTLIFVCIPEMWTFLH